MGEGLGGVSTPGRRARMGREEVPGLVPRRTWGPGSRGGSGWAGGSVIKWQSDKAVLQ